MNVKNNIVGSLYVQISEKYYTFKLTFSFDGKVCIYGVHRLIKVACWEREGGDEKAVGRSFISITACLLDDWHHKGALKTYYIPTLPCQPSFLSSLLTQSMSHAGQLLHNYAVSFTPTPILSQHNSDKR
jgi:hypothetical protein